MYGELCVILIGETSTVSLLDGGALQHKKIKYQVVGFTTERRAYDAPALEKVSLLPEVRLRLELEPLSSAPLPTLFSELNSNYRNSKQGLEMLDTQRHYWHWNSIGHQRPTDH